MIHSAISSSNQKNILSINQHTTNINSNAFYQDEDFPHQEQDEDSLFQYNYEPAVEVLPSYLRNDSETQSYHSSSCSNSEGLKCYHGAADSLDYPFNNNQQEAQPHQLVHYSQYLHHPEQLQQHIQEMQFQQESELQRQFMHQNIQQQDNHAYQIQQSSKINYYNCAADMNSYSYLSPQSCCSSSPNESQFEVKLELSPSEISSYNYSEEETALEHVLSCPSDLHISRNYYQLLMDYEHSQKQQEWKGSKQVCEQTKTLQQQSKVEKPKEIIQEADESESEIKKSNKKNVVKNIMSAFKNFILEGTEGQLTQQHVLALYNSTKKGIMDDLLEMQAKFKRYITSKNFNHYTVKLLIQHINYSPVFKYFLEGPAVEWVTQSKVADVSSHLIMIDYLKDCFVDISKIDILKRHEKKRAHYQ